MVMLLTSCAATNAQEMNAQTNATTNPVVITFSHPKRASLSGNISKHICPAEQDKEKVSVKIDTNYIRAENSEIISLKVIKITAGSLSMPENFIDRINASISALGQTPRITPYCEKGMIVSVMLSIAPNEKTPAGTFRIIMRDPDEPQHNP